MNEESRQKEEPNNDKQVMETTEKVEVEQVSAEGICEICGADFTDKPNPEASLKAHKLRAHKIHVKWRKGEKAKPPEVAKEKELVRPKIKPQEIPVRFSEEEMMYLEDRLKAKIMADIEAKTGVSELRSGRYGYSPYRRPWEREQRDELDRKIDQLLDRQSRIGLIRAMNEPQPHQTVQPQYSNPEVEGLKGEVSELRKSLEEERRKRQEDQMNALRDEIKDLKNEIKNVGVKTENFYGLATTTIKETADLLKYDLRARFNLPQNPEERVERQKIEVSEEYVSPLKELEKTHPELVE